ncbi:MAG: hypothetical protein WCG27_02430 [Pseudomonadota bacterium]
MKSYLFLLLMGSTLSAETTNLPTKNQYADCSGKFEFYYLAAQEQYNKFFPKTAKKLIRKYQYNQTFLNSVSFDLIGSESEHEILTKALDGNPPPLWFSKASTCTTVFCAFHEMLENEESAWLMMVIAKRDRLTLDLSATKSVPAGTSGKVPVKNWSKTAIRNLNESLRVLPPYVKTLPAFQRFYAVDLKANPKTKDFGGLTQSKDNKSDYFPTWQRILLDYRSPLTEMIIHELGHAYDYSMHTISEKDPFCSLNWEKKGKKFILRSKTLVSEQAYENVNENFAEDFTFYITDPKLLKETSPKDYNFIKANVFYGKEYFGYDFPEYPSWPEFESLRNDPAMCLDLILESSEKNFLFPDNSCRYRILGGRSDLNKRGEVENVKLSASIHNIRLHLSKDRYSYCRHGGNHVTAKLFREPCPIYLNKLSQSCRKIISDPGIEKYRQECLDNKESDPRCIFDKLMIGQKIDTSLLSADLVFKNLPILFLNKIKGSPGVL